MPLGKVRSEAKHLCLYIELRGVLMTDERIKELMEEKFSSWKGNGEACKGCIFSKGSTPFDDAPDKCSCAIYTYPRVKPDAVFLEGGKCKYYR